MKSLSLSRPLVIMMVGLPGAGKSFFARQFSEAFQAPLVSVDRLRSELFTSPTFAKEEDQLIDRIVSYEIEELVKTHKSFIIDGGCNSKVARQQYEKFARLKGYSTLVIWVQTDEPTSMLRATKRSEKRAGDVNNASMSEAAFVASTKKFTAPTKLEPTIVISGKHTYAAQFRVVLKKLAPQQQQEPAAVKQPQPRVQPYGGTPPAKPRQVTIN